MARSAVGEADRYLDGAEPGAQRAVRRFDLERVALGVHCVEIDALEDGAAVALEAAGEIANRDAEQHARVPRTPDRDEAAAEPPVVGSAARDVARSKREVGALHARVDQPGHIGGVVREVAVHLEHVLGAVSKRAPEAGEVCRPQAFLPRAMEDGDKRKLFGKPVGHLAGAVGRVVVDDEHAHAERCEGAQHRLDVLALVVRRQANDGALHGR